MLGLRMILSCHSILLLTFVFVGRATGFVYKRKSFQSKRFSAAQTEIFESSWKQRKILASGVTHADFAAPFGRVRGLEATDSFEPNDVVISLPTSECLSASESSSDANGPSGFELWKNMKGTSRLSLCLLQEWMDGNSSKVADYMNYLPNPNEMMTPIHWPAEVIDSFPYQYLSYSVQRQSVALKSLFTEVKRYDQFRDIPYDRFVWAFEIVGSRAFQGVGGMRKNNLGLFGGLVGGSLLGVLIVLSQNLEKSQLPMIFLGFIAIALIPATIQSTELSCVLLPAIDSANHASLGFNCNLELDPLSGTFKLRANQRFIRGNQVLITYGNRSNDDLLQYFGFVEPQNPFDVYTISSPVAKLLDILQQTGVQQDDMRVWLDDAVPGAELESLSEALRHLSKRTPSDSASEDKLVVNRKEPQTWALSSLTTLFAAENNSLILKSALAVLLKTEFNIVSRGIKNYSIELAGSCNESRLQDHNKLASVFLEEKLDVLQSALTHLTAWEN